MGSLFGYCGQPEDGLLERMAERLSHRSACGWERISFSLGEGCVAEIGRGIPRWTTDPQVARHETEPIGFGFSGVLFNDRHLFSGTSHKERAENLMEAIALRPPETIESLEGAFVGAFVQGRETHLVRDPSGIKALYWTHHNDRLVFASEIKALFADPIVQPKMRMGALPEYLTFSFVPGERTMFEDIFELQPGHRLTCREGRASVTRYFRFEEKECTSAGMINETDYIAQIQDAFRQSIRDCCSVTAAPPAVFLSGGIDSSAVLAMAAQEFPKESLKTFSVHFGPRYANENEFVSMMTERYQTDHTWLEIRPAKFLKQLKEIIWKLDDPIGDPITVPNYMLAQAASKVSCVVLNGEGGDPCFGGPKNIPMMLGSIYGPLPGEPQDHWVARNYLQSYRKCFTDLNQLLKPDVMKESGGEAALFDIVEPYFKAEKPGQFLNKLMSINIRLKGSNLILVKVDKMTSANGLLALAPLFSKQIIEASMACPASLKLMGNIEKGVLKKTVESLVPQPIIDRPKSGMMVPVRFWLQKDMRRYARRVLSKKNLRKTGFFNPDYVKKILDYDKFEVKGSRHGLKLWMLITFMLWHEQMVEGKV
jgi:asparagine synthase (glutamine-hydrolysing)